MQVDTGADSTVISSKIWTDLGKPQLDGKIRHFEAYDGHQLTLLGSLTCDVEWNGSRLTQISLCTRRGDSEDSISENHKMGNSSNGFRL